MARMEKTDKTYTAWGIDKGVHEATGLKPMLTPEEQVALLKSKGVTFERCDEEKAVEALTERDTFLHIASYRKLFQTFQGGKSDGLYAGLDFADLVYLDGLDHKVRRAFLMASQDVERLARVKLMDRAVEHREDGYSIVAEFMESQQKRYRNAIESDLKRRMGLGADGDEYSGDLIRRYAGAMPLWVFLEVVTFGTLLALYLFCAERWQNAEMREEHYILKGVKSLRNCCSHGSCILNGFDGGRDSDYALSSVVYAWLAERDIGNSRTRRAKLHNRRMQQLVEALVMLDKMDDAGKCVDTRTAMTTLRESLDEAAGRYGVQHSFVSYLRFLSALIDRVV